LLNFILFILTSTSLTSILVWGHVFDRIRPDEKFFHCCQCVGFHSGWAVYIIFYFADIVLPGHPIIAWFVYALISSGTSYAMNAIVDDNGIKIHPSQENKKT